MCQRRPGDPSILVAEATRARELLGWSAERSDLATIIADAWRWHKIGSVARRRVEDICKINGPTATVATVFVKIVVGKCD